MNPRESAAGRDDVRVRPRRPADLPALCDVLAGQQAASGYPIRWPLPFPTERFIARPHELGAWVAERGGPVVGHVSVRRVEEGAASGDPGNDPGHLWSAALGCAVDDLAAVGGLFVAHDVQGAGVGRRLLDEAVTEIRSRGLRPCLDVQGRSRRVRAVYAHLGWVEVGTFRPGWLPEGQEDEVALVLPEPAGS